MTKPSIPKGTRDFGPSDTARRNFIFETIKKVFMLHGFSQIETPAMENLSTLLGKYGDEGDKLLFRILNSGDFLSDVPGDKRDNPDAAGLLPFVSDKGLRYDLTVPFARFVVQHQNEISFPFKRFQIQPVWRADRPQRGRYREFFQCDADVIGSDAIVNEFEMVQLVDEVFAQLGIEVTVHVNNRKILYGIAEVFGYANKFSEITVAIDKLDKTGRDKVKLELTEKGVDEITADRLLDMYCENAETDQLLISLEELFINSETGRKGLSEINELLEYCNSGNLKTKVKPDVSLARGLNYYTGAIFEVKADKLAMGSICGGGRYDNLTGIFGLNGVSGVGISFGAERIFDIMLQENLFPQNIETPAKVLFVNFGKSEELHALRLISKLRHEGISAVMYPDQAKMKKQIQYADDSHIPFIAMMGEDEIARQQVGIKNLKTGEQQTIDSKNLVEFFKLHLV